MVRWQTNLALGILLLLAISIWPQRLSGQPPPPPPLDVTLFLRSFVDQPDQADQAFEILEENWDDSYVLLLLELSQFTTPQVREDIFTFLEEMTGDELGPDRVLPFRNAPGYAWIWRHNPSRYPDYADFKAALYARVDRRLGAFFGKGRPATIWLDEVRWTTTVRQETTGLRNPRLVPAANATLAGSTAVFGLVNQGMARAYPKFLLTQHQLVKDELGEEEILCVGASIDGTVVFYRAVQNGVRHELEASGFFYRSNPLLYDEATKSLWSSMAGAPVVGPLAGRGFELDRLPFVSTTWGEWRRRHPETSVILAEAGETKPPSRPPPARSQPPADELLFPVPRLDRRLKNKAEVLGLRWTNAPNQRLALSVDFLRRQRVYNGQLGNMRFVILTDRSGANRVYQAQNHFFTQWNGERSAVDRERNVWSVSEDELRLSDGRVLARLPEQRAFWFAWSAGFPDTGLVK